MVIIGHRGLLMEQAGRVLALEEGRVRPVPGTGRDPIALHRMRDGTS